MIPISIPFDEDSHPARLYDVEFGRVLVVFIPTSMFKPNARVFGDTKDYKSIRPIAQALQMFSHLIYHPELCVEAATDEPPQESPNPSWYYPSSTDDGSKPKTRQFLEAVYATDMETLVGWRWFLFSSDPAFNMGIGVVNTLQSNAFEHQKSTKQPRRGPPKILQRYESFRRVLSVSDWAYTICDTYLNARTMSGQKETIHDREFGISSPNNPSCPYNVFTLERAMDIRGANATQSHEMAYRTIDAESRCSYRFPLPEHVWEVDTEYFNPGVLTRMEFPTESKTTSDSPLKELCLFRGPSKGGEYKDQILDIMEATHGFSRSEFVFNHKSDFAILEQIADKMTKRELNRLHNEVEKQEFLTKFKRGWMEDFRKFWCPESHISANIKHMMTWECEHRLEAEEAGEPFTFTTSHRPLDTNLSPFANLMMRRMVQYEKLLKTSTVHRELLITCVATRDAYRRSFDLHTNPLLAGAGSSSKSYLLNCVEKLSISGTVQTVTHITAKADAIDDNQNDLITLFHEMPKSLMGFDEIGTTGDPMFKERLTSNKFKTKLFCWDEETGKRSNRVAESECIGVMGGCTNDPPGKIPEALRSRFLMIMCPRITREGHEVIDQFGCPPDPIMKQKRDEMIHEHHCEQYLICLIHKLIWTKVLCDVNLGVAHTIFRSVIHKLEEEGVASKDPRHYTRVENTARTLTIMNAIHICFNTPGGALYKKPFDVRDLFAIEPYLFCTEEIAYFAISLLQDMYINPAERTVAQTLREFTKYSVGLGVDGDVDGCDFKRDDQSDTNHDLNYVRVKGNHTYEIACKIAQRMRKNKSSPENICAILKELEKRTIRGANRNQFGQQGSVVFPIYEYDRANKEGFISTAWLDRILDQSYANLMQKSIRGTFHKHSRPRTILIGETFLTDDMPHIWKTMQIVPNTDHTLFMRNTGYKTEFELACLFDAPSNVPEHVQYASQPNYEIDGDLERVEFLHHLDSIGVPSNHSQEALPEYSEEAQRERFPDVPIGVYPQRFVQEYREVLDGLESSTHKFSKIRRRVDGSVRTLRPRKRVRGDPADDSCEALTEQELSVLCS